MIKEINKKTLEKLIEELVLKYGNDYELGNAIRQYYWKHLRNE